MWDHCATSGSWSCAQVQGFARGLIWLPSMEAIFCGGVDVLLVDDVERGLMLGFDILSTP